MNKGKTDYQLLILISEYVDKFKKLPPIFSETLLESRIKIALADALTANKPIESIPEN